MHTFVLTQSNNIPEGISSSGEHQIADETSEIVPMIKDLPPAAWVLGVVCLAIALIAWIKVTNFNRLVFIFKTIYVTSLKRISRDEFVVWHNTTVAMVGVFVLMMGLVMYYVHEFFALGFSGLNGLLLFLQSCAVVLLVYFVKLLAIRFTAYVFQNDLALQEYTRNIVMFSIMLGIVLIPVVVAIAYADVNFRPFFIYTSFAIIALVFLLRLLKGVFIGMSTNVSRLYIFLYLCTLEILPLVVLTKLFMSKISLLN